MRTDILYAPEEYWDLPATVLRDICNGCGAGGKFDFVPDRLFGLDISECCNIHDYMYYKGITLRDKSNADQAFLDNMLYKIEQSNSSWLLRLLRRWLALHYYRAVVNFGGPAFWAGK